MRATQRLLPRAGQEVSFSPLKKKGSGGGGVKEEKGEGGAGWDPDMTGKPSKQPLT